jgi:peptidoglycan-N-acetylglucosamine deacetylase
VKRHRSPLLAAALLGLAATGLAGLPALAADPSGGHRTVAGPSEPTVVRHGPRVRAVVALTFDDGYAPWNVRRIVRVLAEEGVTATFFLNGVYMRRDPALWRAVGMAGHAIGNHTYLHQDATRLSSSRLVADLRYNQRVVEAATGRPMAPIFRPPYGRRNAATDAAAAAAGFPEIVMWDVSAADATRHPHAEASIRAATRGRAGSIVLMHAGPRLTPRILRAVIRSYRERGFTFVTVPALLGLPEAAGPAGSGAGGAGWPEAACRPEDRSLDCAVADRATPPVPLGDDLAERPAAGAAGDGTQADRGPAVAIPRRTPVPDRPPARSSAWARGPGATASVAILTVGLLAVLLAAGLLLAGRRPRRVALAASSVRRPAPPPEARRSDAGPGEPVPPDPDVPA